MGTTEEKNSVIVELYNLSITERKDDRTGRIVKTKSLKIDDLVKIAVNRRTDLNAVTLRSSHEILRDIAAEQIANGASVEFGLAYYSLGVEGVFIGDNAQWDNIKHKLNVKVTPTSALRSLIKHVAVNVRGMASVGTVINSIIDVESGEENSRLTPGSAINIVGVKIKIAGDHPDNGVALINETSNTVMIIPVSKLAVNDPSRITLVVPATLPEGDYKLSITTQFSNSTILLKEPRTYLFDYILTV